jgi:hypothetical protein
MTDGEAWGLERKRRKSNQKKKNANGQEGDCEDPPLLRTAKLTLVNNVRLLPDQAVLFRQPFNTLTIQAVEGTQQFSFDYYDPIGTASHNLSVADLRQNSTSTVELHPMTTNGRVRVEVQDIGLPETTPARTDVTVSSLFPDFGHYLDILFLFICDDTNN